MGYGRIYGNSTVASDYLILPECKSDDGEGGREEQQMSEQQTLSPSKEAYKKWSD